MEILIAIFLYIYFGDGKRQREEFHDLLLMMIFMEMLDDEEEQILEFDDDFDM